MTQSLEVACVKGSETALEPCMRFKRKDTKHNRSVNGYTEIKGTLVSHTHTHTHTNAYAVSSILNRVIKYIRSTGFNVVNFFLIKAG